ncbi:alpha/beta-Hydrolases superfamily protein [Rhynchospora pubera]|uniref:Phospholipase A1 n=1 Tax=Rhynchospora pubera TaxID=906938 RepID=A0AAV8DW70_9POAL|nr:alpha/beta-Hydrolases superfamily protein [Rhynchospora pubera]KAJ4781005.1 alpha/beta-Hydrolases superfamily protein [Rhynchospora pubera]
MSQDFDFFGNIAQRWREIHGNSNWQNLLDPIDIDLRRAIINYGELSQAAYDGFNGEYRSPNLGKPRYKRGHLLEKVQVSMPKAYEVTKYLYATASVHLPEVINKVPVNTGSSNVQSNWMGFIAVATDEGKMWLGRRDIVVAWRGTQEVSEWLKDMDVTLVSASELVGQSTTGDEPSVHNGFLSIYTSDNLTSTITKQSARDQALTEIARLMDKYSGEETSITITGHSLGAAIATLNAIDIVSKHLNRTNNSSSKTCPVTAIVFASPRVGNSSFKNAFSQMSNLRLLRVRNVKDVVPNIPPPIRYTDIGVELTIDVMKSPFIKGPGDVATWHDLESYMHGVAGWQKDGFNLVLNRDICLVNKFYDCLKEEYNIPIAWWVRHNKDMIKGDNGRWRLDDCDADDDDI